VATTESKYCLLKPKKSTVTGKKKSGTTKAVRGKQRRKTIVIILSTDRVMDKVNLLVYEQIVNR